MLAVVTDIGEHDAFHNRKIFLIGKRIYIKHPNKIRKSLSDEGYYQLRCDFLEENKIFEKDDRNILFLSIKMDVLAE
jgi:hypothetical protein